MEKRRRSRSKTPFLRSTCNHESCDNIIDNLHHIIRHSKGINDSSAINYTVTPVVPIIIEEKYRVISSASMGNSEVSKKIIDATDDILNDNTASSPNSALRGKEEYEVQIIDQNNDEIEVPINDNQETRTFSSNTRRNNSDVVLGFATSTPKGYNNMENIRIEFSLRNNNNREKAAPGMGFVNDRRNRNNDGNLITPINSRSLPKNHSSIIDVKNIRIDPIRHLPYLEYMRLGEYWNKTPKTDYTYSPYSRCRRMLAPGVVAMPNMSRRGLRHCTKIPQYSTESVPGWESYMRRRYNRDQQMEQQSEDCPDSWKASSDDDEQIFKSHRSNYYEKYSTGHMYRNNSRFIRLMMFILNIISNMFSSIKKVNGSSASGLGLSYYNNSTLYAGVHLHEDTGFLQYMKRPFIYIYRSIYSLISAGRSLQSKNIKRLILSLLILISVLLLIAYNENTIKTKTSHGNELNIIPPSPVLKILSSDTSSIPRSVTSSQLLKETLKEQYDSLFNHMNHYLEQVMAIKIKEEQEKFMDILKLLTTQTDLIKQIATENLNKMHQQSLNEVSPSNLDVLVESTIEKLQKSGMLERLFESSIDKYYKNDNIRNVIKEELNVKMNTDELVERIVKSQLLKQFIDDSVNNNLKSNIESNDKVKSFYEQFDLVKMSLNKREFWETYESKNMNILTNKLQQKLHHLVSQFERQAEAVNDRFATVINDILTKVVAHKNDEYPLLKQQIKKIFIEMSGLKEYEQSTETDTGEDDDKRNYSPNLTEGNLQKWLHQLFVAKDDLEQHLSQIKSQLNEQFQQEIDHLCALIKREINDNIKIEMLKQFQLDTKFDDKHKTLLNEDDVKNIVKSILSVYDADKTGLVDYALESSGGQVISTRCTEIYQTKSAQLSIFGIALWYPTNTPRIVISPNIQPGNCWAFEGFPGILVLKLSSMIYVTGFTLEHIPKVLAPNGRINSAPREFSVWGLENVTDLDPILLGEYEFTDKLDSPLQYFPVENSTMKPAFEIVELRIESNHGHPLYTCVYRFRVHGIPVKEYD